MAESEKELKSLLMTVKQDSEKVDLKLNIHKTKIIASGTSTSWQIEGENVEAETYFFFFYWPPKSLWTVTATMKLKGTCSLKEKLRQT